VNDRRPVTVDYRGRAVQGEWWVEGGQLHVSNELGTISGAVAVPGRSIVLPSKLAERLLWRLARQQDPKPPFFSWW